MAVVPRGGASATVIIIPLLVILIPTAVAVNYAAHLDPIFPPPHNAPTTAATPLQWPQKVAIPAQFSIVVSSSLEEALREGQADIRLQACLLIDDVADRSDAASNSTIERHCEDPLVLDGTTTLVPYRWSVIKPPKVLTPKVGVVGHVEATLEVCLHARRQDASPRACATRRSGRAPIEIVEGPANAVLASIVAASRRFSAPTLKPIPGLPANLHHGDNAEPLLTGSRETKNGKYPSCERRLVVLSPNSTTFTFHRFIVRWAVVERCGGDKGSWTLSKNGGVAPDGVICLQFGTGAAAKHVFPTRICHWALAATDRKSSLGQKGDRDAPPGGGEVASADALLRDAGIAVRPGERALAGLIRVKFSQSCTLPSNYSDMHGVRPLSPAPALSASPAASPASTAENPAMACENQVIVHGPGVVYAELYEHVPTTGDDGAPTSFHDAVEARLPDIASRPRQFFFANPWESDPSFRAREASDAELTRAVARATTAPDHEKLGLPSAYMTFLWWTDAPDSGYIQGVIALSASLQEVGAAFPLVVVMVVAKEGEQQATDTKALLEATPGISRVITFLSGFGPPDGNNRGSLDPQECGHPGALARMVDMIWGGLDPYLGSPTSRYSARFYLKLLAFGMTEYHAIAVLDADQIALRNPDAALAWVSRPSNVLGFTAVGTGIFASNFFALRPNCRTLRDMLEMLHMYSRFEFPDQDFLNLWFGPDHPEAPTASHVRERLPQQFVCNAMSGSQQEIEENCTLVDFASCGLKPWHAGGASAGAELCEGLPPAGEGWMVAAKRWRQVFSRGAANLYSRLPRDLRPTLESLTGGLVEWFQLRQHDGANAPSTTASSANIAPRDTAHVVIFTRDRAAQLDLLLRSLDKHLPEWTTVGHSIIACSSRSEFARGYVRLRETRTRAGLTSPNYLWEHAPSKCPGSPAREPSDTFRETLIQVMRTTSATYTLFLTDDVVFRARVNLDAVNSFFASAPNALGLNLVLWPGITHCYMLHRLPSPPPEDLHRTAPETARGENVTLAWRWQPSAAADKPPPLHDWSYPMSITAKFFRTSDLAPLLDKLPSWYSPNSLESSLNQNPLSKYELDGCFAESKAIALHLNRVQDDVPGNRHMSDSTLFLLHASHDGNAGLQLALHAPLLNEHFLGGARMVLPESSQLVHDETSMDLFPGWTAQKTDPADDATNGAGAQLPPMIAINFIDGDGRQQTFYVSLNESPAAAVQTACRQFLLANTDACDTLHEQVQTAWMNANNFEHDFAYSAKVTDKEGKARVLKVAYGEEAADRIENWRERISGLDATDCLRLRQMVCRHTVCRRLDGIVFDKFFSEAEIDSLQLRGPGNDPSAKNSTLFFRLKITTFDSPLLRIAEFARAQSLPSSGLAKLVALVCHQLDCTLDNEAAALNVRGNKDEEGGSTDKGTPAGGRPRFAVNTMMNPAAPPSSGDHAVFKLHQTQRYTFRGVGLDVPAIGTRHADIYRREDIAAGDAGQYFTVLTTVVEAPWWPIDAVLFINLDERTDRRANAEQELGLLGVPKELIHRVSGTNYLAGNISAVSAANRSTLAAAGCADSFHRALQLALKNENWKTIMVVEDDIIFKHPEQTDREIGRLFSGEIQDWDVMKLAMTAGRTEGSRHPGVLRSICTMGNIGLVIRRKALHAMAAAAKEARDELFLPEARQDVSAVDVKFCPLQLTQRWYGFAPPQAGQIAGRSNIRGRDIPVGTQEGYETMEARRHQAR